MEPIFTDEQLNTMSRENLIELMKIMRDYQLRRPISKTTLCPDERRIPEKPLHPL